MESPDSVEHHALRQQIAALTAQLQASERQNQALQRAHDQLAQILEYVGQGITVFDPAGQIVYANLAAARLLGYADASALQGLSMSMLMHHFSLIDNDGLPFDGANAPSRLALEGGQPPPIVLGFRQHPAEPWRWSSVTATPIFDAAGDVQLVISIWHDISALKQSERAMRAQREYFAVTLESIGDGVIVTNPHGVITLLNPVAARLTGWNEQAAIGQPLDAVFRIINHLTRQPVESPASKVAREGTIVGLANHTMLITRSGRELPIADSGAPIKDADGSLIGIVLVFRDVSQQYAAEDALRASEARFRMVANTAPVMIWQSDPNGACIFFNETWLTFAGRPMAQELGTGWTDRVHPADLERCLTTSRTHVAAHQPFQLEYRLLRFDGEYRWLLDTATPLGSAETFQGFIGSSVDITEQKRIEEDQRFLAEITTVLSGSLDYITTLATVAQMSVPRLGDWCALDIADAQGELQRLAVAHSDPAKVSMAHEIYQRYPPNERSGSRRVFQTGQTVVANLISDEMLAATAENADHLALLQAIGFRSALLVPLIARQRNLGVLALISSESDRQYLPADIQLAENLAQRAAIALDNAHLYQEAQQALKLRDQFLALASHEIKTPLTTVLGSGQLLQRQFAQSEVVTDRMRRRAQTLLDQVQRLQRLISSVFDLVRIEEGKLSLEESVLDLRNVVQLLVAELQPTLIHHTLTLSVPSTACLVCGDQLRLEQLFQNVLLNAIKYSPAGGIVHIVMELDDRGVCCQIQDQGMGIPPRDLPHIFERFYRASNVNTQQLSGMGIGLYVAQEIVRLHKGTLTATSSASGSTFMICLPSAKE